MDEKQIKGGEFVDVAIVRGIRYTDKFIVCLSKPALESGWVDREFAEALAEEREVNKQRREDPDHPLHGEPFKVSLIVPVDVDGYFFEHYNGEHKEEIKRRNIIDFTRWKDHDAFEVAFARLLDALRYGGEEPRHSILKR